jgi:predicted nucleotidyltransferase
VVAGRLRAPHGADDGNLENRPAMRLPGAASHAGYDTCSTDVFESVFVEAITALEDAKVPYLVIGGLASAALGRPRCSADVDLFVRPRDALDALAALGDRGFETEQTNPHWLFKAIKRGVLVDVLFKGPRDQYVDDAMLARARVAPVCGKPVRLAPPEDLVLMKALVHDEETPRHWHDALALIATGDIDWEYLVWRARKGGQRVLSLLFYARSLDLAVPKRAVDALLAQIEGAGGEP